MSFKWFFRKSKFYEHMFSLQNITKHCLIPLNFITASPPPPPPLNQLQEGWIFEANFNLKLSSWEKKFNFNINENIQCFSKLHNVEYLSIWPVILSSAPRSSPGSRSGQDLAFFRFLSDLSRFLSRGGRDFLCRLDLPRFSECISSDDPKFSRADKISSARCLVWPRGGMLASLNLSGLSDDKCLLDFILKFVLRLSVSQSSWVLS